MFLTTTSHRLAIFIACYVARAGADLGTSIIVIFTELPAYCYLHEWIKSFAHYFMVWYVQSYKVINKGSTFMHLQGLADKVTIIVQNADRRKLYNYSYPGEFNKYIPAVYFSYFKRKRA